MDHVRMIHQAKIGTDPKDRDKDHDKDHDHDKNSDKDQETAVGGRARTLSPSAISTDGLRIT